MKCHKKWNVTKTEMSPKLKCHQNWNVTKTEMLPKLKCHKIKNCHKNSNLNQNKNPGDRHWSPWSCLYFKPKNPSCMCKTASWIDKVRTCWILQPNLAASLVISPLDKWEPADSGDSCSTQDCSAGLDCPTM